MMNVQSLDMKATESKLPALVNKGKKRSRPAAAFLTAVAVLSAIVPSASGFSAMNTETLRQPLHLQVSKVDEVVITRVKPKKAVSEAKRRKALKAMKGNSNKKVDDALKGMDAQVLELLSEHFLYPETISASVEAAKSRPKGRPEFVPGAMNYETMIKFRERQEVIDIFSKGDPTIAPYISPVADLGSLEAPPVSRASASKKGKGIRGAIGASKLASNEIAEVGGSLDAPKRKRKRVVKSLPKPRSETDRGTKPLSRKRIKGSNLELSKYYRTELLSADEEYSLGMKIQFMVKCEHVHEGLATNLMRLPTIEEWAEACGFTEEDPSYIPMEGDKQIRPQGSEAMFVETDPNMFVGNGLAHTAGPGRGRGRAKKPPPMKLKDFCDDSELRAANGGNPPTKKELKALDPINRGTVSSFIEMMMTAREAKQKMVQSNMRLVVSIARKYSNVGVNLQDLVQEGSLGLSRAAEKFEPAKGFKFSTYASWWIQQAVFRSIAYHSRTIRLPVHIHNLLNRVRKVRNSLERDLGRAPTNEEMAESLDMTPEKYNTMLRLTKRSISLEMPKYQSNPKDLGHESEDLLGDTIDSNSVVLDESTPQRSVDRGLFQEDLNEMLDILNEDERRVICARYGLADGLTRTVTLVASQMKESKSWVRSQECRALRKLRRPWYEKKLKEHQDALSN